MTYLENNELSDTTFKVLKDANILTVERLVCLSLAELQAIKNMKQSNVHEILEMLLFHFNLSPKNDGQWCRRFVEHTVDKHMQIYLKRLNLHGDRLFLVSVNEIIKTGIDAWAFAYLSYYQKPTDLCFATFEDVMEHRETRCAEQWF